MPPNKTKKRLIRFRGIEVIDLIFLIFSRRLSERVHHAPHDFPFHALFRWRVRSPTVTGNELQESRTMCRPLVVLPRRHVSPYDVRKCVGGRLKPVTEFPSLLHVQVQERPPSCIYFHFNPCSFNFIFWPDFW